MATTDLNQLFNTLLPLLLQASQRRRQDNLAERKFEFERQQTIVEQQRQAETDRTARADKLKTEQQQSWTNKMELFGNLEDFGAKANVLSSMGLEEESQIYRELDATDDADRDIYTEGIKSGNFAGALSSLSTPKWVEKMQTANKNRLANLKTQADLAFPPQLETTISIYKELHKAWAKGKADPLSSVIGEGQNLKEMRRQLDAFEKFFKAQGITIPQTSKLPTSLKSDRWKQYIK